jgi:hypothetical protein
MFSPSAILTNAPLLLVALLAVVLHSLAFNASAEQCAGAQLCSSTQILLAPTIDPDSMQRGKSHQEILTLLGAKRRARSQRKSESNSLAVSQTPLPMAKRCSGACTQLKMQTGQNATVSTGQIDRSLLNVGARQLAAERSDRHVGRILGPVSRASNERCHA